MPQPRVRWPIAAKLSILVVVAAIVPLAIVSFIGVRRGLAAIEATALRNLELVAAGTAGRLDQIGRSCARAGRADFVELTRSDIPLGIEHEWIFTEQSREGPEPGTLVVIGTDGIWEARDASGELFGTERMREVIRAHASEDCDAVVKAVVDAVRAHIRGGAQQDDITVVAVRLAG